MKGFMSDKRFLLLAGLLLLVLVFATHGRSVWGDHGFVNYDDPDVVVDNERFHRPVGEAVAGILTERTFFSYLPLYFLSLGLDRVLFGFDATGYHLVNVLLHALNALLVLAIVLRLSRDRRLAMAAGLIFAVLPGLTESVAWVASRKDLVSFFLVGLAMLLALRSRGDDGRFRVGSYVGSLILLALAMLAKGTALVLPLLLLTHALLARRTGRIALKPLETLPHFGVALLLTVVHYAVARSEGVAGGGEASVGALLVADLGILGRYVVALVAAPFQTVAHHVVPGRFDAWTLVGLAVLAGVAAAVVRGGRAPWLALGALWFLLALAPFNNVLPRTSLLLAERYLYVPALGASLVTAWLLTRLPRPAFPFVVAGVVVVLGVQTWWRTGVWEDSETLWRDATAKAPDAYLPHQKLGEHLAIEMRRFEEARDAYERAAERATTPRETIRTAADLGTVLLAVGRPEEALARLEDARSRLDGLSGPERAVMSLDLEITGGKALEVLGRFGEALEAYRRAARLAPEDARGPYNAGTLLLTLQQLEPAAQALREAVRRAEAGRSAVLPDALLNLASLELARGRPGEAEKTLRRAEAAGASRNGVVLRRARLLWQKGEREGAFDLLRAEVKRRPNDPAARGALAVLFREETKYALGSGDDERALRAAREAVTWHPNDASARLLLARVLVQNGKHEEALRETEAAALRDPGAVSPQVRRDVRRARGDILLRLAAAAGDDEAPARVEHALAEGGDRLHVGDLSLDRRLLSLAREAGGSGERRRAFLRGLARLADRDREAGLAALGAAAGDASDRLAVAALAVRGVARLTSGDPRETEERGRRAVADLEEAARRAPDDAGVRLVLARVREWSGDAAGALADYEAVLESEPGRIDAELGIARALAHEGRMVDALARLNVLTQREDAGPEVHRTLAEIYIQRHAATEEEGLLEAAAEQAELAAAKDPSSPLTLTLLARLRMGEGDAGGAIALLREALEARPDLEAAKQALAAIYVRSGRGHLEQGSLDAAEDLTRRAAALAPRSVEALLLRGDVHRARKRFPEARRDYEEARGIDPEGDGPRDALAGWYKDVGYHRLLKKDREGAFDAFRKAVALDPAGVDLSAVKTLLETEDRRARRESSIGALLRAGRDKLREGDAAAARDLADKALELDKGHPYAHFLRALALQARNDRAGAEEAYRAALKTHPEFAEAELNLAALLYTSGRHEEALKLYRAYLLHVDPASPGAASQIPMVRAMVKRLRERLEKDESEEPREDK
jgi:tetratricopeptide (TPR) repeat protein